MKMFFPRFSDKKTSWQNRSLGSLAGHERRITKYWDTRHMQRVILKKRIFGFFQISNPHLTPGSGSRYLNVTCTKNTTNKLIWWLLNYDQSTNLIYEKCLIFNKTFQRKKNYLKFPLFSLILLNSCRERIRKTGAGKVALATHIRRAFFLISVSNIIERQCCRGIEWSIPRICVAHV